MAEPANLSEDLPPDAERGGRGQSIFHGAADMGLLAPTPLAFGVVAAAVMPSGARAATSVPVSDSDSVVSAPRHGAGSATFAEAEAISAVRPVDDSGIVTTSGITGPTPIVVDLPIDVAINGRPIAFAPFGNAGHAAPQPPAPPDAGMDASVPTSTALPPADTSDIVGAVRTSAEALTGALEALVSRLDVPAQQAVAEVASTIDDLTNALAAQTGTIAASAGDTTAALVNTVTETLDESAQAAAQVASTIDGLTNALDAHTGALLSSADDTVAAIEGVVTTSLDTAVSQVDALLDQAGGLAADLNGQLDRLPDAATAVIDQADAVTAPILAGANHLLAAAATDPAGTVVADLAAVATDAAGDVEAGLTGADPLGGLATLSGLLEASDGFEIVQEANAVPIFASVAAIPEIVEPVTDTVTADIGAEDGGLLDTASDLLSPITGGVKHGPFGLFDGDHDHG